MTEQDKKTVLIYAGEDLVDLLVLNRLVPELVSLGVTPTIVFPKKPKLTNPNLTNPDVVEYGFYQHDVIQDTIIPYLDSKPVVLASNGELKADTCYTPNQLANHFDLEILKVDDVNSESHIAEVEQDSSIVGALSVRCMQIFKQPAIDAIKEKGFFYNAHPGDLPNYRGVIPVFRAMLNGDKSLQWTLHTIDEGIDTGPKHAKTSQIVDRSKSVFWHYNTNADNVSAMILQHVQGALNGEKPERYVQKKGGAYYSYPSQELTSAFHEAGGKMVEPRHEMEKFLHQVFVPRVNPNRDEFKAVLSRAIDEQFGPKNANSFSLGPVANDTSKVRRHVFSRGRRESGPTATGAVA